MMKCKDLAKLYSSGWVPAADALDFDKFQNHFLLTAASLGSQLLKNYDLGTG
jgi:hypothetical protein